MALTSADPLTLERSIPLASTVGVNRDTEITLTFSQPISTESLHDALHIEGTLSGEMKWTIQRLEGNEVILRPDTTFRAGEWVTVGIDASLQSDDGVELSESVWFEFRVKSDTEDLGARNRTSLVQTGAAGPRFTFTSDSEPELAYEVLLGKAEHLATRKLGVDVVQIQQLRTGGLSRMAVQTGWYLTPKTFFSILNEVDSSKPKTYFMLEYALNEELELVVTQGNDSRQGVDLQWRRDY